MKIEDDENIKELLQDEITNRKVFLMRLGSPIDKDIMSDIKDVYKENNKRLDTLIKDSINSKNKIIIKGANYIVEKCIQLNPDPNDFIKKITCEKDRINFISLYVGAIYHSVFLNLCKLIEVCETVKEGSGKMAFIGQLQEDNHFTDLSRYFLNIYRKFDVYGLGIVDIENHIKDLTEKDGKDSIH